MNRNQASPLCPQPLPPLLRVLDAGAHKALCRGFESLRGLGHTVRDLMASGLGIAYWVLEGNTLYRDCIGIIFADCILTTVRLVGFQVSGLRIFLSPKT